MLTIYLAGLLFGGTLVLISLLGGAVEVDADLETDLDTDGDLDADLDADVDGDGDGSADVALGWLPVASLRFWTFLLSFGGLTGALLTWLDTLPAPAVAALSLGVGYAAGLGITRTIAHLRAHEVGTSLRDADFVGTSGSVLLPVTPTRVGLVRIEIGGRLVDRTATTEDAESLPVGTAALVYGVDDDGTLQVTRVAALTASAPATTPHERAS